MSIRIPKDLLCVGLGAALAIGYLAAIPADAAILYFTGFEPPAFTVGPLAGQNGWAEFPGPSAVAQVSTLNPRSGVQDAAVIPALASGQDGPYYADNSLNPIIVQSADIYLYSSSTQSEWQFASLGPGLAPFAGGIDVLANNSIKIITAGFPVAGTFTRDAWNHVDLILNYVTQTYSVDLNAVQIASNVPFCGDNGPCTTGLIVPFHASGFFDSFGGIRFNDLGLLDNYTVATPTVPEPGTLSLLGLGLAGLAALRRRKLN